MMHGWMFFSHNARAVVLVYAIPIHGTNQQNSSNGYLSWGENQIAAIVWINSVPAEEREHS
jgi:hypothetical protein